MIKPEEVFAFALIAYVLVRIWIDQKKEKKCTPLRDEDPTDIYE